MSFDLCDWNANNGVFDLCLCFTQRTKTYSWVVLSGTVINIFQSFFFLKFSFWCDFHNKSKMWSKWKKEKVQWLEKFNTRVKQSHLQNNDESFLIISFLTIKISPPTKRKKVLLCISLKVDAFTFAFVCSFNKQQNTTRISCQKI